MNEQEVNTLLQTVWPDWRAVRLLGRGSYGEVYEIHKTDFGEEFTAALKVIPIPPDGTETPAGATDQEITEYYEDLSEGMMKEFRILSKMKGNSYIVSYEDHIRVEQTNLKNGWIILIRMELLTPFSAYLETHTLQRREIIQIGMDLCRGLELCRQNHVIHRDLKPSNLFVSQYGTFKLGDFGAAAVLEKTSMAGTKMGTALYMAPEVYAGKPYSDSVDQYSLGLLLYQLLNDNRLPFMTGKYTYASQKESLDRRMAGEPLPPPAHADKALADVLCKACSYDPGGRYASPTAFREALEAALEVKPELPQPKPAPKPIPAAPESPRSKPKKKLLPLLLGGAAAAVILVALLVLHPWAQKPEAPAAPVEPPQVEVPSEPEPVPESVPEPVPEAEPEPVPEEVQLSCGAVLASDATVADLRGLSVADLQGVEQLPLLEALYVDGGTLTDLTPLSRLEHLKTVEVRNVPVKEILCLKDLPALESLDLHDTAAEHGEIAAFLEATNHRVAVGCYSYVFYDVIQEACSWSEAKTRCEEAGGHLATFQDEEEYQMIVDVVREKSLSYVWLGASYDGQWNWVTGEPWVELDHWYPGEPSRQDMDGTPETCLCLWMTDNVWSLNDQRDALQEHLRHPELMGYVLEQTTYAGSNLFDALLEFNANAPELEEEPPVQTPDVPVPERQKTADGSYWIYENQDLGLTCPYPLTYEPYSISDRPDFLQRFTEPGTGRMIELYGRKLEAPLSSEEALEKYLASYPQWNVEMAHSGAGWFAANLSSDEGYLYCKALVKTNGTKMAWFEYHIPADALDQEVQTQLEYLEDTFFWT